MQVHRHQAGASVGPCAASATCMQHVGLRGMRMQCGTTAVRHVRHPRGGQGRARCSVVTVHAETDLAQTDTDAAPPQTEADSAPSASSVPRARVWQLDFSSRPVLDERGKKKWELLICDEDRQFEFSRFFSNNQINSTQLKNAISELISQPGAQKPERIKFFRGQMQTIISRAVTDLQIKPIPSRRCFTLLSWLRERTETVYQQLEGFSASVRSPPAGEPGPPKELPDTLRGEAWQFVQLPLADLQSELQQAVQGRIFGDTFPLAAAGAGGLPPDALVPGIAVFSRRAEALAAWTSGVELASVSADTDRACLILETGVNDRFRYGRYRRTPESTAEARAWEEAKTDVSGMHFLAIQSDEEAEESSGLWLLQEYMGPPA